MKNITSGEGGAIVCNDAAEAKLVELHRFNGVERIGGMHGGSFPGHEGQPVRYRCGNRSRPVAPTRPNSIVAVESSPTSISNVGRKDSPLRLPARGDDGHSWQMLRRCCRSARCASTAQSSYVVWPSVVWQSASTTARSMLFAAYRRLGFEEGDFPIAERIGRETITLPISVDGKYRHRSRDSGRACSFAGEWRMTPDIWVVIPVFNEEQGLSLLCERLFPALDVTRPYEVIFVDDGSRDGSATALQKCTRRVPTSCACCC
jgi:hypothetical protein